MSCITLRSPNLACWLLSLCLLSIPALADAARSYQAYGWYDSLLTERYSHPREAISYGIRILGVAAELPDTLRANTRVQLGFILNKQGFADQGLEFYRDANRDFIDLGLEDSTGYLNIDMGNIHFHSGRYDCALEHYLQAEALFEATDQKAGHYTSLNNQGLVYLKQGAQDRAEEVFQKALEIARQSLPEIAYLQALSFRYLADLNEVRGDQERMTAYLDSALAVQYHPRDQLHAAELYSNLAYIWLQKGDTLKAIGSWENAATVLLKQPNLFQEIEVKQNLARLHQERGEVEEAIRILRAAVAKCQESGSLDLGIRLQRDLISYLQQSHTSDNIIEEYQHLSQFQDLRYQAERENYLQRLEIQDLLNDYQHRLQVQSDRLERSALLRNGLIVIGVLLIVLIWVLSRSNLRIRKARADLEVSNNSLQEAIDTKNRFFSIIAHDLRSPFNVLIGFSRLLQHDYEQYDEVERRNMVQEIAKVIGNTYRLLENLLEWSRAQTGKLVFKPEPIDLKSLVGEVATFTAEGFMNKHIQVDLDGVPEIEVRADRNMLSTILRNLISNAGKFSNPGGLIEVTASRDSRWIRISVRDHGVGIEKEKLESLFDSIAGESTRGTCNEPGTGLGLRLSKEFAEMHGGEIQVQSTPGSGTTFTFTILIADNES